MVIKAKQKDSGIVFETDGMPISSQRKVSFVAKIPNQPDSEHTITYLSDAALVAEVVDPQLVYYPGSRITVIVSGGNKPYEITSPDSGLVVTRDESRDDTFYIDVVTVTNLSATLPVSDSDAGFAEINLTLDKFHNLTYLIEPDNRNYNNEDIYFVIQGTNSEIIASCDNPLVTVERSRAMRNRFRCYMVDETNTCGTVEFSFSAVNETTLTVPVEIRPLVDIDLTHKVSPVKPGENFVIVATNVPENLEAYSSTDLVNVSVENQGGGTFHIICKCEKDIDANISIFGRGIKDTSYVASFVKTEQFYLQEENVITDQMHLPYRLKVMDSYLPITVSSDNPDILVRYDNMNKWVVIEAGDPNFSSELTGILTLSHPNQKDVTCGVVIVPALEENKPVMGINGTTIRKPVGLEFFINTPILVGNDSISASCDNPDCHVEVRQGQGNRVYISADHPGSYSITIRHSKYKDAVLTFLAEEPVRTIDTATPPVNESYDLGEPLQVSIDNSLPNFVEEVLADNSGNLESKCSYILNSGNIPLKNVGHSICPIALALDPSKPRYVLRDGVSEVKELYGVIEKVLKFKDYVDFKEGLLFILMLFKVYKDKGLNIENLFMYNNAWGYTQYSLPDFVKTIRFITDYVNKDGVNINPYEYDLDADITNKLVIFCSSNIRL